MSFAFSFTSTHKDLVEGFSAFRTAGTGMRPWARGCFIGLGVMWLLGGLVALVEGTPVRQWWQPGLSLSLGLIVLFSFVAKPLRSVQRIRQHNPAAQRVDLTYSDAGIDGLVVGVGQFHRSWSDVVAVVDGAKGIGLTFADRSGHWLPNRVFKDPGERAALLTYLRGRLERM
jgi:hypothetical protein